MIIHKSGKAKEKDAFFRNVHHLVGHSSFLSISRCIDEPHRTDVLIWIHCRQTQRKQTVWIKKKSNKKCQLQSIVTGTHRPEYINQFIILIERFNENKTIAAQKQNHMRCVSLTWCVVNPRAVCHKNVHINNDNRKKSLVP